MRQYVRGRGQVRLPRVHRVESKGVVYKYHRVTRAELPNDVSEDHPSFVAAWSAEEAKGRVPTSKAAPGSVAAACDAYLASGAYKGLSDSYRQVIRRHVEAIKAQGGNAKLSDLRHYHVNQDLDPLSPAVARSRLKAWRKLGAFWEARGMTPEDVTAAARAKPMPKTDGHKEWTHSDVEAFRAHWGIETPQRLALEMFQWTAARCIDAVRLGPGMIDRDGLLVFTQVKTKVEASVPWFSPALGMEDDRATLLDLTTSPRHMVYLVTAYGKPRSHKAVSQWFSQAATDAGLPDLTAHGLRKYRLNRLAENGASVLQMQAWAGHLSLSEIEHYTRKAERRTALLGTKKVRGIVKP